jgi:fimbrial chaperone protein
MFIGRITAFRILSLVLFLSIFKSGHAGYSMSPLVTILDLSSKNPSGEVVIKYEQGDAKVPLAVEMKVKGREVSFDGARVLYHEDKASDDFVVFPSQIVLLPGETQRVQIKWVGESIPKKEIAYGLICEQAPVKLGDEDKPRTKAEGRLYILVKYEGIILVRPGGIKPNTSVDSAGPKVDSTGKAHLVMVLNNTGTARQVLKGMKIQVTPLDKNGKMIFNKTLTYVPDVPDSQNWQKLYAGFRRKLDFPWPDKLPVGPVKVSAEFEPEK